MGNGQKVMNPFLIPDLLKELIEKYDEIVGENPDDLVRDFTTFLKAKKAGSIGIDPFMGASYTEFAEKNKLAETNLLQANPSILVMLRGLQDFIARAGLHLQQKHEEFFQQIAILFMGLETAARPAVEIFQLNNSTPQKFTDPLEFEKYCRFDKVNNQKYSEAGHLGCRPFVYHPNIKANVWHRNDNTTQIRIELTYYGAKPPKKFPPISAFLYTLDQDTNYFLMWLLKNSRCEDEKSISFKFPLFDFGYPKELVNEPYQKFWRYLDPYPNVLDFLFEIHDLSGDDFQLKAEKTWYTEYRIRLDEKIPEIGDWSGSFFINAFPIFYWHQGEAYTTNDVTRIRYYEDARRIIWIRVGRGMQQIAAPLYYVDRSGEGTGWVTDRNRDVHVRVLPLRKGRNRGDEQKIGVHALFAGNPIDEDEELHLRPDRLSARERAAIHAKKLIRSKLISQTEMQSRWNWSPDDREKSDKFWGFLYQTIKQPHDDEFIKKVFMRYILQRIRNSSVPEWLQITSKDRALVLSPKASSLVPCTQIVVVVNCKYFEDRDKNWKSTLGMLWKAIDRFHPYLSERLPPNIFLQISLYKNDENYDNLLETWL